MNIVAIYPGVPRVGSVFAEDAGAYCVNVTLDQSDESPYIWYLTAEYDSKPELPEAFDPGSGAGGGGESGIQPGDRQENPLLRAAQWSVSFNTTTEPAVQWYEVDDEGDPAEELTLIQNTAGLPFNPPLTVEVSRPVVRVVKNIPPPDLTFFTALQDAVNSKPWRGVGPRVFRIGGVSGQGNFENGVAYFQLSLDLMVKWDTWDLRPLNCGFMEKVNRVPVGGGSAVAKWQRILTPGGMESGEPVPLDGLGTALTPGFPPVYLRGVPKQMQLLDFNTLLSFL